MCERYSSILNRQPDNVSATAGYIKGSINQTPQPVKPIVASLDRLAAGVNNICTAIDTLSGRLTPVLTQSKTGNCEAKTLSDASDPPMAIAMDEQSVKIEHCVAKVNDIILALGV